MGPKVSISCTLRNPSFRRALWSGQFWVLRFGTTLQYGGHDCFHSEVPFGGRYIPFGTPWEDKAQTRHRPILERGLGNNSSFAFKDTWTKRACFCFYSKWAYSKLYNKLSVICILSWNFTETFWGHLKLILL